MWVDPNEGLWEFPCRVIKPYYRLALKRNDALAHLIMHFVLIDLRLVNIFFHP